MKIFITIFLFLLPISCFSHPFLEIFITEPQISFNHPCLLIFQKKPQLDFSYTKNNIFKAKKLSTNEFIEINEENTYIYGTYPFINSCFGFSYQQNNLKNNYFLEKQNFIFSPQKKQYSFLSAFKLNSVLGIGTECIYSELNKKWNYNLEFLFDAKKIPMRFYFLISEMKNKFSIDWNYEKMQIFMPFENRCYFSQIGLHFFPENKFSLFLNLKEENYFPYKFSDSEFFSDIKAKIKYFNLSGKYEKKKISIESIFNCIYTSSINQGIISSIELYKNNKKIGYIDGNNSFLQLQNKIKFLKSEKCNLYFNTNFSFIKLNAISLIELAFLFDENIQMSLFKGFFYGKFFSLEGEVNTQSFSFCLEKELKSNFQIFFMLKDILANLNGKIKLKDVTMYGLVWKDAGEIDCPLETIDFIHGSIKISFKLNKIKISFSPSFFVPVYVKMKKNDDVLKPQPIQSEQKWKYNGGMIYNFWIESVY